MAINCAVTRRRLPALCTLPSRMWATPNASLIPRMSSFFALEGECRGARRNFQPRHFSQRVDDLFGQPVTEILVILVAAHIGEGQHGDGGSLRGRLLGNGKEFPPHHGLQGPLGTESNSRSD